MDTCIGEKHPRCRYFIGGIEVKRCGECGVTKEINRFAKRRVNRDGVEKNCKLCDSASDEIIKTPTIPSLDTITYKAIHVLHRAGVSPSLLTKSFALKRDELDHLLTKVLI